MGPSALGHHLEVGARESECATSDPPHPFASGRRTVGRRTALSTLVAGLLATRRAHAAPDHEIASFHVPKDGVPASRFALLLPKGLAATTEVGLVIALHGLGETHDETLGIRAWPELYGLSEAHRRLRQPPLARTSLRKDFTEARLREINADLARTPFVGLCVACPFTPNPKKLADRKRGMAAYARWLADVVIPEAERNAPIRKGRASRTLVGCSMGATVALEVLETGALALGGIGFVQGALSRAGAKRNAERIVAARGSDPFDVHLLTSEQDPFLDGHRALAEELASRNVAHELRVLPGPHDQPWLREAGAIETLLHQERRRSTP